MTVAPRGLYSVTRRRRRLTARRAARVALVLLVLGVLGTALGLWLWLRGYTPIGWQDGALGPGPGTLRTVVIQAATGSEGKPVIAASRAKPGSFSVFFDLHNSAPFTVRVEGPAGSDFFPERLLMGLPSTSHDQATLLPFRPFDLAPDQRRRIGVEITVPPGKTCRPGLRGVHITQDVVGLRFSFLHVFHRSASVEMPIVADLVCGKLPPPYPG